MNEIKKKKTPVIMQTDIGGDIDDFWALVMLLKQPWLDLKFILTDTSNTVYRAAICAKLLSLAGRDDIEVGAGIVEWPEHFRSHYEWVKDYRLKDYPSYTQDGIDRFIEIVRASAEPITLVAIGPAPSLAAALRKAPDIAHKINFKGMFGSIRKGYNGEGAAPEYNVYKDIDAAKTVFSADWLSAAITPLDTCNWVVLGKDLYGEIEKSDDPLVNAIKDVYRVWRQSYAPDKKLDPPTESSKLYDTVCVHMASSYEYLKMERMNLIVSDDGFTKISPHGKPFDVAIDWTDLPAYEKFLTDTLIKQM